MVASAAAAEFASSSVLSGWEAVAAAAITVAVCGGGRGVRRLDVHFQDGRGEELVGAEGTLACQLNRIPVGRLGRPEDIAALAAFLCSDAGGFVNGQMIASNGGAET